MQLLTARKIDQNIVELVAWSRERYGIPEGCTGQDACEALGLRLRVSPLPSRTDGLLTEDGAVVVNEAIVWPSRVEFTIFHEVMHWLLDEHGELIELFAATLGGNPAAHRAAIERCCHAGAAEFLAPRHRVREIIANDGFSVDLVRRLSDQHQLSIIASAIQVAACAPVDCYVAVCSYGVVPEGWPPDQTLYVEQAAMRPEMRYPWARYSAIPRDHLFYQVWHTKCPLAGPSYVPFRSGTRMECEHGEAKPVGERMIGILYRGHPPRSGQLRLGI